MSNSGLADNPLFISPSKKKRNESQQLGIKVSSNHNATIAKIARIIRKKGTNASTYRFTSSEKQSLLKIIYKFRRQEIKITENDIVRIAINFLIENFETEKEDFLQKVISINV